MDFSKSGKNLSKPVDYYGANVDNQLEWDKISFS